MHELTPALLRWLDARLAAIPPGGTLTVTWRRDRAGHLLREVDVQRRESWDEETSDRARA